MCPRCRSALILLIVAIAIATVAGDPKQDLRSCTAKPTSGCASGPKVCTVTDTITMTESIEVACSGTTIEFQPGGRLVMQRPAGSPARAGQCGYPAFELYGDNENFSVTDMKLQLGCETDASTPVVGASTKLACPSCDPDEDARKVHVQIKDLQIVSSNPVHLLPQRAATERSVDTVTFDGVVADLQVWEATKTIRNDPRVAVTMKPANACQDSSDGTRNLATCATVTTDPDGRERKKVAVSMPYTGSATGVRASVQRMVGELHLKCPSGDDCSPATMVRAVAQTKQEARTTIGAETLNSLESLGREMLAFFLFDSCKDNQCANRELFHDIEHRTPISDLFTREHCSGTTAMVQHSGVAKTLPGGGGRTTTDATTGASYCTLSFAKGELENVLGPASQRRRLLSAGSIHLLITTTKIGTTSHRISGTCGDGFVQGGKITASVTGTDTAPVYDCSAFDSNTSHATVRSEREQCDISALDHHTVCCHSDMSCRAQSSEVNERDATAAQSGLYTSSWETVINNTGTRLITPSTFKSNVGADWTSVLWATTFRRTQDYDAAHDTEFVRDYAGKVGTGACNPYERSNFAFAKPNSSSVIKTFASHCCHNDGSMKQYDVDASYKDPPAGNPYPFPCLAWPTVNVVPNTFIANDAPRDTVVHKGTLYNVRSLSTYSRFQDMNAPHFDKDGILSTKELKGTDQFRNLKLTITCAPQDQASAYPFKKYHTRTASGALINETPACKKCAVSNDATLSQCLTPTGPEASAMAVNHLCPRMFQTENPCSIIRETSKGTYQHTKPFRILQFRKGWCVKDSSSPQATCRCSGNLDANSALLSLNSPQARVFKPSTNTPYECDAHTQCRVPCNAHDGGIDLTPNLGDPDTPQGGVTWSLLTGSSGGTLNMARMYEGTKDVIYNDMEFGAFDELAEKAQKPVFDGTTQTLMEADMAVVAAYIGKHYPDQADQHDKYPGLNYKVPSDDQEIKDYRKGYDMKRGVGRSLFTLVSAVDNAHSGSLVLRFNSSLVQGPSDAIPYHVTKKACVHHAAPDPKHVDAQWTDFRPMVALNSYPGIVYPYHQNEVRDAFLTRQETGKDATPYTQTSRYSVVGEDVTEKGFLTVEHTSSVPRWSMATHGTYIRGDAAHYGAMHYHSTHSATPIRYQQGAFGGHFQKRLYRQTESRGPDEEFTFLSLKDYLDTADMIPRSKEAYANPASFRQGSNYTVAYSEMEAVSGGNGAYHSDTSRDPTAPYGTLVPSKMHMAYVKIEPTTCARSVQWLTRDQTYGRAVMKFDIKPKIALSGAPVRPKMVWPQGASTALHVIPQNKIVDLNPSLANWYNNKRDNSDMWYYAFITIEDHSEDLNSGTVNALHTNNATLQWNMKNTHRRHSAGDIVGPKSWDSDQTAHGACKPYRNAHTKRVYNTTEARNDLANVAGLYDFNFVQDPATGKITKRWYLFPTCAVRDMYVVPNHRGMQDPSNPASGTVCQLVAGSPRGHSNCHPQAKKGKGMSFSSYNSASSGSWARLTNDLKRENNINQARNGKFAEHIAFRPHYGFVGTAKLVAYVTVADFTKSTQSATPLAVHMRPPIYAVSDSIDATVTTTPLSEDFKITVERMVEAKLLPGDPTANPVTVQVEKQVGATVQARIKAHTSHIANNQFSGVCALPVEDFDHTSMGDPFTVTDQQVHGIANDAALSNQGGCDRDAATPLSHRQCTGAHFCTLNAYEEASMSVVTTTIQDKSLDVGHSVNIDHPQEYPYGNFPTTYWMQLGADQDASAQHGMKTVAGYTSASRVYDVKQSMQRFFNDGAQKYWIDSQATQASQRVATPDLPDLKKHMRVTFLNDFNTYSTQWGAMATASSPGSPVTVHTASAPDAANPNHRTDVVTTEVYVEVKKTLLFGAPLGAQLEADIKNKIAQIQGTHAASRLDHNSHASHKFTFAVKPTYDAYAWSTALIPQDPWNTYLATQANWSSLSGGPLGIPRWDAQWDQHHRLHLPNLPSALPNRHWLIENEVRASSQLSNWFGGHLTVPLDATQQTTTGTRVNKDYLNMALKLDFVTLIEGGSAGNQVSTTYMDNSVDYVRFTHETCGTDPSCANPQPVTAGQEGVSIHYASGTSGVDTAKFFGDGDDDVYDQIVGWSTGVGHNELTNHYANLKRPFPSRKPDIVQVRDKDFPNEAGIDATGGYTKNPTERTFQLRGFILKGHTNWYKQQGTDADKQRPYHRIGVHVKVSDRSGYAVKSQPGAGLANEESYHFVAKVLPVATAPKIQLQLGGSNQGTAPAKTESYDSYAASPAMGTTGAVGSSYEFVLMEGTLKNLGLRNITTSTNEHAFVEVISASCSPHANSAGIHRCLSNNFEAHVNEDVSRPTIKVDHGTDAQPFQLRICIDPSAQPGQCSSDKLRMLNPLAFTDTVTKASSLSTFNTTTSPFVIDNIEIPTKLNPHEGLRFVWKCETLTCDEIKSMTVAFPGESSNTRLFARVFSAADASFEQREARYINLITQDGGRWCGPKMQAVYPSCYPYTSLTPNFQKRVTPLAVQGDTFQDACVTNSTTQKNCAPGLEFEFRVTPKPKVDTVQFNATVSGRTYSNFRTGARLMYVQDTANVYRSMIHDDRKYGTGASGKRSIALKGCIDGQAVAGMTYAVNVAEQSSLKNGAWQVRTHMGGAPADGFTTFEDYSSYEYPYQNASSGWSVAQRRQYARYAFLDTAFIMSSDANMAAKTNLQWTNGGISCKPGQVRGATCDGAAAGVQYSYAQATCVKNAEYSDWTTNTAFWPSSAAHGTCNLMFFKDTQAGTRCKTVELNLKSGQDSGMANYPTDYDYTDAPPAGPSGIQRFTMAITPKSGTDKLSIRIGYETVTFYVGSSAAEWATRGQAQDKGPVSHMYSQTLSEDTADVDGLRVRRCTTQSYNAHEAFQNPDAACGAGAPTAAITDSLATSRKFTNAYAMTKVEYDTSGTTKVWYYRGLVLGIHRAALHYGPDMAYVPDATNANQMNLRYARSAMQVQLVRFKASNPTAGAPAITTGDFQFKRSFGNQNSVLTNEVAWLGIGLTQGIRGVANAAAQAIQAGDLTAEDFGRVSYKTCTGQVVDEYCPNGFVGVSGFVAMYFDEMASSEVAGNSSGVAHNDLSAMTRAARKATTAVRAISLDTLSDKDLKFEYYVAGMYGMVKNANNQYVTVRPYARQPDVALDDALLAEAQKSSVVFDPASGQMYQKNTMVMDPAGQFVDYGRTLAPRAMAYNWEIATFDAQGGKVQLDGIPRTTDKYSKGHASDAPSRCDQPFDLGTNSRCRVDVTGVLDNTDAAKTAKASLRYCRDTSSSGDEWKYVPMRAVVSAQNPYTPGTQTKAFVRPSCSSAPINGVCDFSFYQCGNGQVNSNTLQSRVVVKQDTVDLPARAGVTVRATNPVTPGMCSNHNPATGASAAPYAACTAVGRVQCPGNELCQETIFDPRPADLWSYSQSTRKFTERRNWQCKKAHAGANTTCVNLPGEQSCAADADCQAIYSASSPGSAVEIVWDKNVKGCVDVAFEPLQRSDFAPYCKNQGMEFVARAAQYTQYDSASGVFGEKYVMLNRQAASGSTARLNGQASYAKVTGISFLPDANMLVEDMDPTKPTTASGSTGWVAGGNVREIESDNLVAGKFNLNVAALMNPGEHEINMVSLGKKVFKGWSTMAMVKTNLEDLVKRGQGVQTATCSSVRAKSAAAQQQLLQLLGSGLQPLNFTGATTSKDLFDNMIPPQLRSSDAVLFAPVNRPFKGVGDDPAAGDKPTFQGGDADAIRSVAAMYYEAQVVINDLLECKDGEGNPVVEITPGTDADTYKFDVCVTSFGKVAGTDIFRGFQRCRRVIMEILTSASLRASVTTSAPLQVHVVSVQAIDATKAECKKDAQHAALNLQISADPNVTAVLGPGYTDCDAANAMPKRLKIVLMTHINVGAQSGSGVAWMRTQLPKVANIARGLVGRNDFGTYEADNCYGLGNRDTTLGPMDNFTLETTTSNGAAFAMGIVYTAAIPTNGNTTAFSTCQQNPAMSFNYNLVSAKETKYLRQNGVIQSAATAPAFGTQSAICWKLNSDPVGTCRSHAFSEPSLQLTLRTTIQFGDQGAVNLLGIALPLTLELFSATIGDNGAYHIPVLAGQDSIEVAKDSNLAIQIGIKDRPDRCNTYYYSETVAQPQTAAAFAQDCLASPQKQQCRSPYGANAQTGAGVPSKGSCVHSHHIECSTDLQCDASNSPWVPVTSVTIKDACMTEFKQPCYDPMVNYKYVATRYVQCTETNAATHSPYVALLLGHEPEIYHCDNPALPIDYEQIIKNYDTFTSWLTLEFGRRKAGTLNYAGSSRKCNVNPHTGAGSMYAGATSTMASQFQWDQGPQITSPYRNSAPYCLYQMGVPSTAGNFLDGETRTGNGEGLYTCKGREFYQKGICNQTKLDRQNCVERLDVSNDLRVKCPTYLGKHTSAGENVTMVNYNGFEVGVYDRPAYNESTTASKTLAFDYITIPAGSFVAQFDIIFELTVKLSVRSASTIASFGRRLMSVDPSDTEMVHQMEFEKQTVKNSYKRTTGYDAEVTAEGEVEIKVGRNLLSTPAADTPNPSSHQSMRAPAMRVIEVNTGTGAVVTVSTPDADCANRTASGDCITTAIVTLDNSVQHTTNVNTNTNQQTMTNGPTPPASHAHHDEHDDSDKSSTDTVMGVVIFSVVLFFCVVVVVVVILTAVGFGGPCAETEAAYRKAAQQQASVHCHDRKNQKPPSYEEAHANPGDDKKKRHQAIEDIKHALDNLRAMHISWTGVHFDSSGFPSTGCPVDVLTQNAINVCNRVLGSNNHIASSVGNAAQIMGLKQIKDVNVKHRDEMFPRAFKAAQRRSASKVVYPRDSDVVLDLKPDALLKARKAPVLWLTELFGHTMSPEEKQNELALTSASCALADTRRAQVLVHRLIPRAAASGLAGRADGAGTVDWLTFGAAKGTQQFDVRLALGPWPGAHAGLSLYAVTPRFDEPTTENTHFVVMLNPNMLQLDAMSSLSGVANRTEAATVASWTSLLACSQLWTHVPKVATQSDEFAKELSILQSSTSAAKDHRKYLIAEMIHGWVAWRPAWTSKQFAAYVRENRIRSSGRVASRINSVLAVAQASAAQTPQGEFPEDEETESLIRGKSLDTMAIEARSVGQIDGFRL